MKLSQKQIKYLKGLGHHLKPVVMVGKEGMSQGVSQELKATLSCHELIKVKVASDERPEFLEVIETITGTTGAALVQTIGRMAILYRENQDPQRDLKKRPKIALPSA